MKKQMMAAAAIFITITAANAQTGNVGIGTSTPAAKLDINGNLIIRSAQKYSGSGVSTLVRDNVTGEVMIGGTPTNTVPMSYTEYVISNVLGDWVSDFDTKIPVGSYVVTVVGSSFADPSTPGGTFLRSFQAGTYNSQDVYAFQSGGTWHLKADYLGGRTNSNGNWTVRVLIINTSFVKILSDQTANLGGANSGSATAAPAGL